MSREIKIILSNIFRQNTRNFYLHFVDNIFSGFIIYNFTHDCIVCDVNYYDREGITNLSVGTFR